MEFNRFDILEAYMLIAIEWGEYALFDRITRKIQFHAPMLSYNGMSENAREIYHAANDKMVARVYGVNARYMVIYNTPGYTSNDISERYTTLGEAWQGIIDSVEAHDESIIHMSSYMAELGDGNVYEIQVVDYA